MPSLVISLNRIFTTDEIARLERDEEDYFKILLAAPSTPIKDWSKSSFYSHTLRAYNFDYPPDQMGLYLTITIIGTVRKPLGLLVIGFTAFVQLKNRNRFN